MLAFEPVRSGPEGATFMVIDDGVASRICAMVSDIYGTLLTTISVADAEAGSRNRFPP